MTCSKSIILRGLYGGVFLDTGLGQIIGISRPFVPITDLDFSNDYLIAVTTSKRFLTLAKPVYFELEVSAAQRFGLRLFFDMTFGLRKLF